MSTDAAEQRNVGEEYTEVVERLTRLLDKYKNSQTQQARQVGL